MGRPGVRLGNETQERIEEDFLRTLEVDGVELGMREI
jgi:hypothetical protein